MHKPGLWVQGRMPQVQTLDSARKQQDFRSKGVYRRCLVRGLHRSHSGAAAKVNTGSIGACIGHVQRTCRGQQKADAKGRYTSHADGMGSIVPCCQLRQAPQGRPWTMQRWHRSHMGLHMSTVQNVMIERIIEHCSKQDCWHTWRCIDNSQNPNWDTLRDRGQLPRTMHDSKLTPV